MPHQRDGNFACLRELFHELEGVPETLSPDQDGDAGDGAWYGEPTITKSRHAPQRGGASAANWTSQGDRGVGVRTKVALSSAKGPIPSINGRSRFVISLALDTLSLRQCLRWPSTETAR
jgi:hypothetical protein